ncbi:MAG: MFS transporter [Steroidobacteraceae bacterium]
MTGQGSPKKIRLAFVLASLTHSAGMNIVTVLALRYFTDNLAMAASVAGLLFAVVKIYDGILDPLLGAASDRTRSPIGRRLPYLLIGSVLMAITVVLLFAAPSSLSGPGLWLYVALILVVHASAYTALTIPGMAMVVEVTNDYHERSTLMSYRVIGNTVGLLVGSTLPTWLLAHWGADRSGHIKVAVVVATVVALAGVAATVMLLNAPRTTMQDKDRLRLRDFGRQLRLAWQNQPFRMLALAHIFVLIGTATTSVTNAYFSRYVLQRTDNWLGNYYLLATIGVFASMPLWLRAARRAGKKRCYAVAMLGFGLAHLTWLSAGAGEAYALLVARALVTGVFSAGLILFAYSMLSDAIRFDYIQTGLRREGAFAGITSLLDKISAAAGIAGVGILMSAMGYVESRSGGLQAQSDSAIQAIYIGFAVIPAIAMLISLLAIVRYRLNAEDLLESRRSEADRLDDDLNQSHVAADRASS